MHLAHHGSILLLNMALIVFDPWAPPCEGQLFLFTIANHLRIEELSAAIGVNPGGQGNGKRVQACARAASTASALLIQQGETFGPAGGEIGQRQGVEKLPIETVPTMSHQIHFHKARIILVPRGEHKYRSLGLAQ